MTETDDQVKVAQADRVITQLKHNRNEIIARIENHQIKLRGTLVLWVVMASYVIYILEPFELEILTNRLFWLLFIPGTLLLAIFIRLFWNFFSKSHYVLLLTQLDRQLAGVDVEQLQESLEEDFFTKLVKINFKYIDQYYLQTQSQADKSFTLTSIVAVFGFLLLVTGVVMMYLNAANVTPAYVTTAAGVISEFTAGVFFYLYNKTIVKMGEYHQKLVLTQNIGLALKITEGLPSKEKFTAQSILVDRLSDNINHYLSGQSTSSNNTVVSDELKQ